MSVIREICDRVVVLERGAVVEQGPVWQVFGAPEAEATRALLQPLQHALPADLTARLRSAPGPGDAAVVELAFTGATAPDLGRIAAAGRVRLLASELDRIQGHPVGRLLIETTEPLPEGLADATRVIGYVDATDD